MIRDAILADDGQVKTAAVAGRPQAQVQAEPAAWLHDSEALEKIAAAMDFVAVNLGSIVDDRTPIERMAETATLRNAFAKTAAEGPQPPMLPAEDTTTFPSTLGAGLQTDLNAVPGGVGAQPIVKAPAKVKKLIPPMAPAADPTPPTPNLGMPLETDYADAPGGTARNPEFGAAGGPGYTVPNPAKTNMAKTSTVRGRYIRVLTKVAQDPSSPQPRIEGKVSGDPQQPATGYFATPSQEGQPPAGVRGGGPPATGEGNQLRKVIRDNAAPVAAKKGQLSTTQSRQDMAALISEPMSPDPTARENLPKMVDAAGPKLSAAMDPTKAALGRALLKKLAAAGAETGQAPENKTGTPADEEKEQSAKKLGAKAGQKAREKTSQFGGGPTPGVIGGMAPGGNMPSTM
jgi:hypothetical protein